jgi:hypothetical protein
MDPRLQELLDKRACEEVLLRYGRTLDWLDADGQQSCFWPDAEIDYGFFAGSGADWVPLVMSVEQASQRRWHLCSGIMVVIDGDSASSESYGMTVGTSKDESGELVDTMFGGRYLDELARRGDDWRISKRTYVLDWINKFPNGLEAASGGDFKLNILQILESGHGDYRPL